MTIEISIVIPCFNEASRIEVSVRRIAEYLLATEKRAEVIFYDDGSTDGTRAILERLRETELQPAGIAVRIEGSTVNRGKGFAVREGGKLASKALVLITDADLSVPIAEIEKLLPYTDTYDLVIGSRRAEGGNVEIPQRAYRVFMGKIYSALSRWMLGVKVRDFTCGFKILKLPTAQSIFPRMTIDRWAYDSELLKIAALDGLAVKEIGVTWRDDRRSKVRLYRDVFGSFLGLLCVIARSFAGRYSKER